MTLNFPDTANTGDVFHDSTSGFSYEWNGTVWISTDPQRAANIKELDDISSGFNGSTTQFNLTVSSSAVEPVSDSQLLISVGGVMQNPTNDYTVSGSTITFTTAPSAGLTFFGTFLGQALSLNNVQNGTVEFASFKTGTAGVGIKSDGTAIGVGITQIDFVGSGNTVVSVGNTVSVYIAAGIDTTGTSKFNNITATGNITAAGDLNVTGNLTYEGVTATNQKISGVTTTGGLNVLGITSTKDLRSVGVATLTTGSATNFTVTNLVGTSATATTLTATNFNTTHTTVSGVATVTGIIDGNGGANISGGAGLVASSAKISDLTSGRVTYAGSSGELQDSGNLTFNGSELTAASATVSDLTDNRVVIAGSSGALEDSSNLTFDGSTLTVNGDMNVQGELTYQEVTEIDSVGFVTARKGLRVTNGGIIVTAGLSTFSDDVKLSGANYDITYDRSASNIIFNDNAKAIFGTGSDLSVYHNGTNSIISNDTGDLVLGAGNGSSVKLQPEGGEDGLTVNQNGSVEAYFDNTKRLETTSVGVNVTGNVDCDSLNNAGITTLGSIIIASNGFSINSGTVTIPDKINHDGDSNTAIRFPAADTFSVETAGTEAFRVVDTGNFLVGATAVENWGASRGHRIQVRGTSVNNAGISALITADDDNPCELVLGKSRSTGNSIVGSADDVGQVRWSANDGAGFHTIAFIKVSMDGTPGSDDLPSKLTFGTSADGGTTVSERMRIDSSGRILIGTTTTGHASADDLTIATSASTGITIQSGTSNEGNIFFADGTSGDDRFRGILRYDHGSNSFKFKTNTVTALTLDVNQNATFAGTVSDSKGNLRSIIKNSQSSAYVAVAADAGKAIQISSGGVTINNSVFSAGDAVTIINHSGSDQTITQGSGLTLYNTADASTGNRTLAGRGMATIWFAAADTAYISGAGLS